MLGSAANKTPQSQTPHSGMAFSTEAFGVSVAINGAICLAVFLFFGLFRKATFAHKFYAPKRQAPPKFNVNPRRCMQDLLCLLIPWGWACQNARGRACAGMRRFMHSRRRRPDPLPPTLWGWIVRVWKIKQDDVIELAGYDAAMYLRILAFGGAL